jgi:hypothetical protein
MRVFAVDDIQPLRSFMISLTLFGSTLTSAKSNFVTLDWLAV